MEYRLYKNDDFEVIILGFVPINADTGLYPYADGYVYDKIDKTMTHRDVSGNLEEGIDLAFYTLRETLQSNPDDRSTFVFDTIHQEKVILKSESDINTFDKVFLDFCFQTHCNKFPKYNK